MPKTIRNQTTTHPDAPALKAALDAHREDLLAMPAEQVEPLSLDASDSAEVVIGSAPIIAGHRDALVELFGAEAGERVDALPELARATKQADVELSAAPVSDVPAMNKELLAEHGLLSTDAQSLANRGLIDERRIEGARSTVGYRVLIHNTLVLVSLLREQWSTIDPHTPLTSADLDRAEAKALRMLTALGEREQGANRVPALDLRARSLTKLVREYEEVRRMVAYLRWHEGDAGAIAPSLWRGRGGRRSRAVEREETDVPSEPAQPVSEDAEEVAETPVVTNGTA
jgi:hypothetical protein